MDDFLESIAVGWSSKFSAAIRGTGLEHIEFARGFSELELIEFMRENLEKEGALPFQIALIAKRLAIAVLNNTQQQDLNGLANARGVSVATERLDKLFHVDDDRVRVECEVANGDKYFFASVMCDTGAQNELTLPARKIVQLGLRPYTTYQAKGSTNDVKQSCLFEPTVKVTMRFRRDGEEVESRTALLVVSCHKKEYDSELATFVSSSSGKPVLNTRGSVTAGSKRKLSEVTDTSSRVEPLKAVKLSPVAHRPPHQPDQRVVLGTTGMRKFHVHANIDKSSLEIEEEVDAEE